MDDPRTYDVSGFAQVAIGTSGSTRGVTFTEGPAASYLFVDLEGYFLPSGSGGDYVPLTETRVVDTRSNTGLSPIP